MKWDQIRSQREPPNTCTSKMTSFHRLRDLEWSPWYGCEWGVQAGQVKGLRAAVTTDQLPSVLTHSALVVVAVNLQRKREAHSCSEANHEVEREQMDYRVCGCLPLVVKRLPGRRKCTSHLFRLAAGVKHTTDFDAPPGTSCHGTRQSAHMMFDCFRKFVSTIFTHRMASHLKQTYVLHGSSLSLQG